MQFYTSYVWEAGVKLHRA